MSDFQSIVVETVDEMPKAQPYVDKMGVEFSDDLHCRSKKTKEPLKNKDGTWRKKPAQPGAKSEVGSESIIGKPTGITQNAKMQGKMAAGLTGTLFMGVYGQDLEPTPDDMANMADSYGRMFEHYGLEDLPPVWGVVVSVAFYALPKMSKPKPRAVNQLLYAKITGKRKKADAHNDNRSDEHGQDVAVETDSKDTKKQGFRGTRS